MSFLNLSFFASNIDSIQQHPLNHQIIKILISIIVLLITIWLQIIKLQIYIIIIYIIILISLCVICVCTYNTQVTFQSELFLDRTAIRIHGAYRTKTASSAAAVELF